MSRKLTVHKKAYHRKAFVAHRKGKLVHVKAAHVPAATFRITDRGAVGRGRPVVGKLKRGTLGVHFHKSESARHKVEAAHAKKYGEKHVVHQLVALAVLNKRTNPELARKAAEDAHWVAGSFKGKKKVAYGTGFRRKSLERVS